MRRERWPRSTGLAAEWRIAPGVALIALALAPPVASWLEASLIRHLLGQYPLLAGGGALLGAAACAGAPARWRWAAAPLILAAALALAFWLIPRWIDAAVADPATDAAKKLSLVMLTGVPLGCGWRLAGPVLRGFVWVKAAAMLAVMGWLQLAVPSRLCNSYLVEEQTLLGRIYLVLCAGMVVAALVIALAGHGDAARPVVRTSSP